VTANGTDRLATSSINRPSSLRLHVREWPAVERHADLLAISHGVQRLAQGLLQLARAGTAQVPTPA